MNFAVCAIHLRNY